MGAGVRGESHTDSAVDRLLLHPLPPFDDRQTVQGRRPTCFFVAVGLTAALLSPFLLSPVFDGMRECARESGCGLFKDQLLFVRCS